MTISDRNTRPGPALLLFLMLTPALSAMAVTVLMPVLPAIGTHFQDQSNAGSLVKALISSVSVAMIFGSALASPLAGLLGTRRTMLLMLALFAVAGMAGLVTDDLEVLLATRVATGFAAATVGILALATISEVFAGGDRDLWLGRYSAGGTISALVIIPLAGLIGNMGWRPVFAMHVIAVGLFVLVLLGMPAGQSRSSGQAASVEHQRSPSGSGPLSARVYVLLFMALLAGIVINALPIFLPFKLAQIGAAQPSLISLAMLFNAAAGAVICLFFGRLSRSLSFPRMMSAGFMGGAVGIFVVSLTASYPVAVVALVVVGIGFGITIPNIYALAVAVAPEHRSQLVIGLATSALSLGAPAGQFLVAALFPGGEAGPPFLVFGSVAALQAILWFLLDRWVAQRPS